MTIEEYWAQPNESLMLARALALNAAAITLRDSPLLSPEAVKALALEYEAHVQRPIDGSRGGEAA